MRRESKALTTYLEIVDQRRRYQLHTLHLKNAYPAIDTSPIPMNQSIADKQQEAAQNRVFKFQLEEKKLKFVNDLQEYNRLNKKKKKYLNPKKKPSRKPEESSNLYSPRVTSSQICSNTQNPMEQSSTLFGTSSSRRSKRIYPKLIEPKSSRKTRKIPMAVQTSNPDDDEHQYKNQDFDDDIDIPFEYTGYLEKGNYSISIDEKQKYCIESRIKDRNDD